MIEVTLAIQSLEGFKQVPLTGDRLTIGRGETADLPIEDQGLSRLHASIHREGDRVWILDEGSTNGSYLNGTLVPPTGAALRDGDQIRIGGAAIAVSFVSASAAKKAQATTASNRLPKLLFAIGLPVIAVVLLGFVMASSGLFDRAGGSRVTSGDEASESKFDTPAAGTSGVSTTAIEAPPTASSEGGSSTPETAPGNGNANRSEGDGQALPPAKQYKHMTDVGRTEFVSRQAQRIGLMMGNRKYAFTDDVLRYVKRYVDDYSRRIGNGSERLWAEDLNKVFDRAIRQAPYIIRSFRQEGVSPIVGLYIPVIECEYRECLGSPAGALGLFQFMASTASYYRVAPGDRCDVKKMAPAAARYMKDRIAEFGTDPMSVALGIAGYNRSPDSVRRDLHDVLDKDNEERSFWTLVANSDKLDHFFQNENVKYVPKFFAAAIVGENPRAFGLGMDALSSYSDAGDR